MPKAEESLVSGPRRGIGISSSSAHIVAGMRFSAWYMLMTLYGGRFGIPGPGAHATRWTGESHRRFDVQNGGGSNGVRAGALSSSSEVAPCQYRSNPKAATAPMTNSIANQPAILGPPSVERRTGARRSRQVPNLDPSPVGAMRTYRFCYFASPPSPSPGAIVGAVIGFLFGTFDWFTPLPVGVCLGVLGVARRPKRSAC